MTNSLCKAHGCIKKTTSGEHLQNKIPQVETVFQSSLWFMFVPSFIQSMVCTWFLFFKKKRLCGSRCCITSYMGSHCLDILDITTAHIIYTINNMTITLMLVSPRIITISNTICDDVVLIGTTFYLSVAH